MNRSNKEDRLNSKTQMGKFYKISGIRLWIDGRKIFQIIRAKYLAIT